MAGSQASESLACRWREGLLPLSLLSHRLFLQQGELQSRWRGSGRAGDGDEEEVVAPLLCSLSFFFCFLCFFFFFLFFSFLLFL